MSNPLAEIKIRVVTSPEHVHDFWLWLTSQQDAVGVDTETSPGADPFAKGFKIRTIQFGNDYEGWAIPFQEWRGLAFTALDWLADHGVRSIWHNLAFDAMALAVEGYELRYPWQEDTYVWASLTEYADMSRALKSIASRKFGRWASFGQMLLKKAMKNQGWTWETVPIDFGPYIKYGVVDPILTSRYRNTLGDSRKRYEWHHSLEIATIEATNRMSLNGLGVNTIYAAEKEEVLTAQLGEVMARLEAHGITSLDQNAKIGKVLNEAGAFKEFIAYTETGQISVAKGVLGKLDHPVAEDILLGRHIARTRSYLTKMIGFAGGVMGPHEIIHPEIRSVEAKTGRMSIANPALQQLPAPDESDPMSFFVRSAVVARNEDEILVGADYGQIELRMFAAITRDQALLDVLNAADAAKAADPKDPAGDFFVVLGRTLYDPSFVKSDPRRQYLKATAYAKLYSGGLDTIAKAAKVHVSVIGKVVKDLEDRFTSFRTLGSELIRQVPGSSPTWEVFTPTGRRFAVSSRDERRKLINYLVQGHSAEILKMALMNIVEAGYADNLMLPVHDEIIMSVPKGTEDKALSDLVECMNAVVDPNVYGVAVKASPAPPAPSWGLLSH